MEKFLIALGQIAKASEEELEYISSLLQMRMVGRHALVLEQNAIENHLSYIEWGSVRYFHTNAEGKETSMLFGFENGFLGEMSSFLTRTPSVCAIEAVTDLCLWQISHEDLQQVYHNTKSGERIGRLVMEQLYLKKTERERSLLSQTAEERYLALIRQSPKTFQEIQLQHIASYLGITPQALSRIRRRIQKQPV